jgi:L-lactate dehydrogenase complex protein LldG
MSSREAFLGLVRAAALQGQAHRVHLSPVADGTGYVGAGGDLCERLAEEVIAVGGQASIVPNLAAAGLRLVELLRESDAASAICWQHDVLERLQLRDLLNNAGVAMLDFSSLSGLPETEQRRMLLAADVGITSCDAAIAETGTLMMCSGPGRERLASLIAPMHIAVVERSQIVPDLLDAFALLARAEKDGLPSNVTFITGPSKTGDIELQLTTGVHGPAKWRVIVIE